ncbi:hypothetical protein F5883DRAFT_521712 [Diaporthe sp. PMI_573]|nr:hypothetical protein F5883DRAFT_521712 [Diaporthaceae sp. PMI_573]
MPTEESAPSFSRIWYYVLQHSRANLLGHSRLRLGALMQETSKAFLDRYNVIQDATIHYIHHAAPRVSTPAELIDLESQPVNNQQVTDTDRHPESIPAATLHSHSDSITLEADSPEEPRQPEAGKEESQVPLFLLGDIPSAEVPTKTTARDEDTPPADGSTPLMLTLRKYFINLQLAF